MEQNKNTIHEHTVWMAVHAQCQLPANVEKSNRQQDIYCVWLVHSAKYIFNILPHGRVHDSYIRKATIIRKKIGFVMKKFKRRGNSRRQKEINQQQ